jgi:hypothetical protein
LKESSEMPIVLKYQQETAQFANCPPNHAKACTRVSYRFVFAEIGDPRNFLPVAKLNPRRRFADDKESCSAHALSMFATKEGAKARYQALLKNHKRIHQAIGTHLAEGNVAPDDGLATGANSVQHFDFFEAADNNIAEKFLIIEALYDDRNQG